MTTARQWPVRCAEAVSLLDTARAPAPGYLPATCCISCHEDEDMGYPLCSATLPDGTEAEICCSTLTLLGNTGQVRP